MTKKILSLVAAVFVYCVTHAQSIGINNTTPDSSAVLDITSSSKGLLIPRMSTAERIAISRPATGLMVFDSTIKQYFFYGSGVWTAISNGSHAVNYVGNSYLGQTSGSGSSGTSEGTVANRFIIGVGDSVLHSNTNGYDLIGIGAYALKSNLAGFSNTAIGKNAMEKNLTGSNNTAIGTYALNANVFGHNNTVAGNNALQKNTTGSFNLGMGNNTLQENTIGTANMAIGYESLKSNTTANANMAIGHNTLRVNTTGTENTAIGFQALTLNTTGNRNVVVGYRAFPANTAGQNNTVIGHQAGFNTTNGSGNVFLGFNAGYNEQGSDKLYIDNSSTTTPLIYGDFEKNKITVNDSFQTKYLTLVNGAANGYVLRSDAAGNASWVNANSLVITETDPKIGSLTAGFMPKWNGSTLANSLMADNGTSVGIKTTTIPAETTLALGAMSSNEGGQLQLYSGLNKNTAYFIDNNDNSLRILSGNNNGSQTVRLLLDSASNINIVNSRLTFSNNGSSIFVGDNTGLKNANANNNIFIGNESGRNTSTGNFNLGIGLNTLLANTTGSSNMALGYNSLASDTTGSFNVSLGSRALLFNGSGSNNVAVGYEAGNSNKGSGNIFIGYRAGTFETGSNKLYIANDGSLPPLIHGDFATKKITINDSLQSRFFQFTNGAAPGYLLMSNDANGNAVWTDRNMLFNNVWGSFGTNIYNNNAGNVGIGNAFPNSKLDVTNTTGSVNANVRSESGTASFTVESPNQNEALYNIGTFVSNNGVGGITSYSRWKMGKANSNEAGGNTGGDFVLNRYTDAGVYNGQPILITRSNGTVTIGNEGASAAANTLKVNGSVAVKVKVVVTSSNNTTMDGTDYMVIYGGANNLNTLTLPAAGTCTGRIYFIINHSNSTVNLNGGINYFTANGITSTSVGAGASVQIVSDGTNWHKIN